MPTQYKRIIFFFLFLSFIIYSFLVYTSPAPKGENSFLTENAVEGKLVFQKYNCIACHQLYGLGGYMGPDLTNVASTKGLDYAKAFILSGTDKMPAFKISEEELSMLLEYLNYVDKTGVSPSDQYQINKNGTVIINDKE